MACPDCNFPNSQAAKYCGGCGKLLADLHSIETPSVKPISAKDSVPERRQITVMFCDLVGSTGLSERLDPEDHRDILRSYQRACAKVVGRYNGYVAQYLGDGVMVYFGYPRAYEDDAERAALAALNLIRAVEALQVEHEMTLQVRVGIATGLVVVGDTIGKGTSWEMAVSGEAPNLAARMKELGEPNTVVIDSTTRERLGEQFHYHDLGLHRLKGFARSIQAWAVTGQRQVDSRFKAVRSSRLTPLISREHELSLLKTQGSKVLNGAGQVVLVAGEAGIGKSRLTREIVEWMQKEQAAAAIEIQCSSYHGQSALYPLIQALHRVIFADRRFENESERWLHLTSVLNKAMEDQFNEALSIVANLLSIPLPVHYSPVQLSPESQRRLTHECLLALFSRSTRGKAVILVLEDLHWADPATLDFADFLVQKTATVSLLALLTSREGFEQRHWDSRPHVTSIVLKRLERKDAVQLIRQAPSGTELSAEVVDTIVAKTDGIPLFVEEYTKAILESGCAAGEGSLKRSVAVPTTLSGLLLARIDNLGEAKEVAQLAAMLGRRFSDAMLKAIWTGKTEFVEEGLRRLIEAEIIYPSREEGHFTFKHALIQDAAYDSLVNSKRIPLHRLIAEVMERQFVDAVKAEPESLARHFTVAGVNGKAVRYWREAGTRASNLAAFAVASRHFGNALDLIPHLPEDPIRYRLELDLHVQVGLSLSASCGYAAPKVQSAYEQARDLCSRLGDTAELYPVLRGLCTFYIVRDELERARELAQQCVRLGQETGRAEYLIEGYNALGYVLVYMGEFRPGSELLKKAIEIYRAEHGETFVYPTSQDPAMACHCLLAHAAWMMGDVQRSLGHGAEAIAMAERFRRPFDLAYAHCFVAMLHNMRSQPQQAVHHAKTAIDLSQSHGFAVWLGAGSMHLAIAKGMLGEARDAIATLSATLAAWHAGGAELTRPFFLAGLAEAYRETGMIEEALSTIDEAITHAADHREHMYDAMLYRIKGELSALSGRSKEEAEADLHRAIEIAKRQAAKMLELRAAMSLYNLSDSTIGCGWSQTLLGAACETLAVDGADYDEASIARAMQAPRRTH